MQQDKGALKVNKALQRGEDPFDFHNADGSVDEQKRRGVVFRKGLRHAARSDIEVLRALFRQVNLLDTPASFLQRTDLLGKVVEGYEIAKDEELNEPVRTATRCWSCSRRRTCPEGRNWLPAAWCGVGPRSVQMRRRVHRAAVG